METSVLKIDLKTIIVDVVLLGIMAFVPALSHLMGLPIRVIEPMRIALLAGMLLVNDHRNAYLLAVLLPLISTLTTGFPAGAKCCLMIVEMFANVALFGLFERKFSVWTSMALSILVSKVVYYGLKALIIGGVVMTTPWYTQLVVILALSLGYALIFKFIATNK